MIRRLSLLILLAGAIAPPMTPAATAQAVALAATGATTRAPAGCWVCLRKEVWGGYIDYCSGGQTQGWWNCVGIGGYCHVSSPGCGSGASLPVDADGASQYVSVGAMLGVVALGPDESSGVQRNCDGLIVARSQSPGDIASVRSRTGVLSL